MNKRFATLIDNVQISTSRTRAQAQKAAFAACRETAAHELIVQDLVPKGKPEQLVDTIWRWSDLAGQWSAIGAVHIAPKT